MNWKSFGRANVVELDLKKSFDIDRFKVNLDGRIGHGAGAGCACDDWWKPCGNACTYLDRLCMGGVQAQEAEQTSAAPRISALGWTARRFGPRGLHGTAV